MERSAFSQSDGQRATVDWVVPSGRLVKGWPTRTEGRQMMGGGERFSGGKEEEGQSQNDVNHQELRSLHPVRLPVQSNEGRDQRRRC